MSKEEMNKKHKPEIGQEIKTKNIKPLTGTEQIEETVEKKPFGKKKVGVLAAIAVVLVALVISLGIYNKPENRLARQLNLGNRYLEEQNYAEAALAFEKAIQIDERCMIAYVNGIEAYRHLDEPENLLAFYERAVGFARSLEGETLAAGLDAIVSVYLAAEDVYTDRETLITLWEEGYEKCGQDNRIRDRLVSVYLARAQECASDRAYEESLQDYDRLLELDGQNGVVLESLTGRLKSYLDVLLEGENLDRVRELEEKYAPFLPDYDFEFYIKEIGEKIFKVKLEEYRDLMQICFHIHLIFGPGDSSFLTYEEKEKAYRPIAESLKGYIRVLSVFQNISEQANELANQRDTLIIDDYMCLLLAYDYLVNIYLQLNEMEECLYYRSQYLTLRGSDYKSGPVTYDQYGRTVREQRELFDGGTSILIYEYNEKNQLIESERTDSTGDAWFAKCTYFSDGRISEETSKSTGGVTYIKYSYPEEGVVIVTGTIKNKTGDSTYIQKQKFDQYGVMIEYEDIVPFHIIEGSN